MAKTIHLPCKNKPLHTAECSECGQIESRVAAVEEKLDTVQEGAEVNVQADWNETDPASDSYILNKPNITPNTVDSELSATSTNPVQNRIITGALASKQDALVSGTNIKTVNGNTLLGSGDLTIPSGSTVSYTQTQTSGTKLGDINIDGTPNTIYAPTIPTNVSAFTNDAGYLTSHQSIKTINSTSMVGTGNVAVQPTLVSGTNIKTVNGSSLLGSGDLTIQGGSDVDVTQVSITVANWNATTTCTVSVTGVTASNSVIVSPAPSSISDYVSAGVYCSAQASGTLTFEASSTPSADLVVNVMIVG